MLMDWKCPTIQNEQLELMAQKALKVLPGVGKEEIESSLFFPQYILSYCQPPVSSVSIKRSHQDIQKVWNSLCLLTRP